MIRVWFSGVLVLELFKRNSQRRHHGNQSYSEASNHSASNKATYGGHHCLDESAHHENAGREYDSIPSSDVVGSRSPRNGAKASTNT